MAGYVLVGFDSAAELSEETKDARKTAPRTIIREVTVSGFFGALLLVARLMAAPSTRRDRVLPFSARLAKVSPRTHTPILPAILVGLVAIAILALNTFQPARYTALASVCIMLLYIAYLMVTGPLLRRRLQGWPTVGGPQGTTADGGPLFSLGRWAIPLNVLAIAWGLAMTLNLAWPRDAVYNPVGGHLWYLQWFALVFLVARWPSAHSRTGDSASRAAGRFGRSTRIWTPTRPPRSTPQWGPAESPVDGRRMPGTPAQPAWRSSSGDPVSPVTRTVDLTMQRLRG